MQQILISSFLIFMLAFTDIKPMLKREKSRRALWFAIPAYSISLAINILIGLNVNINHFNEGLVALVKYVMKID